MIDYQELYEKIRDIAFSTRRALSNTAAPMGHVERAKNMLYNNMDAIEEALKFAAGAQKEIQLLEVELADAEREIDELSSKPKTTRKNKKAENSDE